VIAPLAVVAVALSLCAWRWDAVRRDRRALAQVEQEIEEGLHGTAARELATLLARRPDSDEGHYLLGVCEAARGRARPADEAWSRVELDSPFAARAVFGRVSLEMERGRFAAAERIIREALENPRADVEGLPILLGPIYCNQGRLDETLGLIETRWNRLNDAGEGASEAAINLVRAHIDLRLRPVSVDVIRSILDRAVALAPDDDRVWLGRANLAIRTGAYDEAGRWIDACLNRRPDDIPVWRARLDWAVASHRAPEATEALKHLPAGSETQAQILRLAAWLASRRGDQGAEQRALDQLMASDPEDLTVVDRLAELAARQGQSARVAELRRQRAEIERLRARYVKLHQRNQPRRDAAEMSRLAERLGRRFEARAFAAVAIARAPDDQDLRRRLALLDQRARAGPSEKGLTPGDALGAELEAIGLSPIEADRREVRGSSAGATSSPDHPVRPRID
jgi:predicted Zn-dependent protease